MVDPSESMVFVAVVRAGSFTAAARRLGLPKSTVSRKVSRLEERLGVRLLQRTTRRLRLTEVGADYFGRIERAFDELEEAERCAVEAGALPRGLLRVTAPVEFGTAILGTLVPDYLEAHPDVRIEIELSWRRVDIVSEGFDIALRVGPLEESSLVARRLCVSSRVICASPNYLERRGTPRTLSELSNHDAIVFRSSLSTATWRLAGENGPLDLPVRGRFSSNHFELVKQATLDGLGISLLPRFVCEKDLGEESLVSILEPYLPAPDVFYALLPSRRHISAKVQSFLDHLGDRLGKRDRTD